MKNCSQRVPGPTAEDPVHSNPTVKSPFVHQISSYSAHPSPKLFVQFGVSTHTDSILSQTKQEKKNQKDILAQVKELIKIQER